ncbi:splicing factor 3A subunit 2-like [Pipra filicauda]|uniref:Splicing factor 3A subunit 2-like n=1 Tax=Pipra filicauda TaxID=649802 RepID=A0A7R5KFQ9_9PASS|nr:splicing factor 3A subunit 2-like [Pipra filicauda]
MPAPPGSAAARRGPADSQPAAGQRRPLRRPHPPLSSPPTLVTEVRGIAADLRGGEQAREVNGARPSGPVPPRLPGLCPPDPAVCPELLGAPVVPVPAGVDHGSAPGTARPWGRHMDLHKSWGGLGQSATLLFGAGCDSQSLLLLQLLSPSSSTVSPPWPQLPSLQLWHSPQCSVS